MLGTLHLFACWVLVIGNGLAGIWALTANRLAWLKTAWLWWFTGFVQLWVLVQLTIAALHLNASDGAPESFHVFYGVLSAVTAAYFVQLQESVESTPKCVIWMGRTLHNGTRHTGPYSALTGHALSYSVQPANRSDSLDS